MKLEISADELSKFKLYVATPMYGGMCSGLYTKSILELQRLCMQHNIEVWFRFAMNESLIPRARNFLVDDFLRSDYTHLLFLDADINFEPRDIIGMLILNKDVVGAPCAKKGIKWSTVIKAIKKFPDIEPEELEKVVADCAFNVVPGTAPFSVKEPLSVLEVGSAYLLIKRNVFDKLREAFPSIAYKPDHAVQDPTRMIHAYFDTIIDTKDSYVGGGSMRYLSEDFFFCQMWRKIGGEVWLCPWIKTQHIGTYAYTADLAAIAALDTYIFEP